MGPRRLSDEAWHFEQVLLHVIDHGIIGLLEKGHNEFLDHVSLLLRSLSLVLRLLNLLKKMEVAFYCSSLLFFALFGSGNSAKTTRDHYFLDNGANLHSVQRARPAHSHQNIGSAHSSVLFSEFSA